MSKTEILEKNFLEGQRRTLHTSTLHPPPYRDAHKKAKKR